MPPPRHVRSIVVLSLVLAVVSVSGPLPRTPVVPTTGAGKPPPSAAAEARGEGSAAQAAGVAQGVASGEGAGAAAAPPSAGPAEVLRIPYRIVLRSSDPTVADAREVIPAVLEDRRGWQQAAIDFVADPAAAFTIVLAEGEDTQALCLPYDVGGEFSCQNGPLVVLNAIRWREGVEHWPDDASTCRALLPRALRDAAQVGPCLMSYRTMLVNHEVGHLLGMHHLRCTAAGTIAPVMEQQSGTLRGCEANPWPTEVELRLAATHQFTLAPRPQDVPFPP